MSKVLNVTVNDDVIFKSAITGINKVFKEYGHIPSPVHWDGIAEIVKAIEGMALKVHTTEVSSKEYPAFTGTFYISSLAPGMGKTTALIETVRTIMSLPGEYENISSIIFLSRLSEIAALVQRIGLDEKDYSVIVSPDEEVYRKGNQNKKAARVLFTTQQMLESRCHDKNKLRKFSEITDFFYQGKPRQVRVWDEAILPSRIMTVELDELMTLPNELTNADLAALVRDFCKLLLLAEDGDLIDVPDLTEYEELIHGFQMLQDFRSLDGKAVRVSKDNRKKTTTLQYADILPDDLAPMLILDASGEQRTTYAWWRESRRNLKYLYSPPKSYAGLTVHHWNRGSARNTLSKKKSEWKDIVDGTLTALEWIPSNEKVLIIYLKPDKHSIDIEVEIKKSLIPADLDRIKFLTWGRHTATNDFKDFKYVILTSLWYYAPAAYEANVFAAKKQDIQVPATKEEKKQSAEGEHRHHVLQAACRGKVRYAIGDKCPEGCHLFVTFNNNQLAGEEFIRQVFPDATYEKWMPLWQLNGVKAKIAHLMLSHEGAYVPLRGIYQTLGIQRYRAVQYISEDVVPYLRQVHGVEVVNVDEGIELKGYVIREAIERPF